MYSKQQKIDLDECMNLSELGQDKDCAWCSLNVCLLDYRNSILEEGFNRGKRSVKESLLEELKMWREDAPYDFCSGDELYGANKILDLMFNLLNTIE